jgi:hypothetical protein
VELFSLHRSSARCASSQRENHYGAKRRDHSDTRSVQDIDVRTGQAQEG